VTSSSSSWDNVPAVDSIELHSPRPAYSSGVVTYQNTQTEYAAGTVTITYPVRTVAETNVFVIDSGSSGTTCFATALSIADLPSSFLKGMGCGPNRLPGNNCSHRRRRA
jgi:hypothetical protein